MSIQRWNKLVLNGLQVLGLVWMGQSVWAKETLDAQEIMRRNIANVRLRDSQAIVKLSLYDAKGQVRIRTTHSITQLQADGINSNRMAKFLEPADVRRTGVLTLEHSPAEDDVWLYLPALKKNRRIGASQKSSSFMGTEFSYTDLTTPKLENYHYRLLPGKTSADKQYYLVESIPVNPSVMEESGYSKSIVWLRKDNYMDVKAAFYDKSGQVLKTMRTDKLVEVDKKNHQWMAFFREMKNVQSGNRTVLEFSDVKVNQGVPHSVFTLSFLERE